MGHAYPSNRFARGGFYCSRLSTLMHAVSILKSRGPERWSRKREHSWSPECEEACVMTSRARTKRKCSRTDEVLMHSEQHFLRKTCSNAFLQTPISRGENIQKKVKIHLRRGFHKNQDIDYPWERWRGDTERTTPGAPACWRYCPSAARSTYMGHLLPSVISHWTSF